MLDTVNRVLAGGDENSSADMGALVLYMAELRTETKAHVAGVHHGTKATNGSTPRGHSCLTGADDALIEVVKHDDGTRTAKVVHAKDDAGGDTFSFRLDREELGDDEDGDPIATLVVEETAAPPPGANDAGLSKQAKFALKILNDTVAARGEPLPDAPGFPPNVCAVPVEDWRDECYARGISDGGEDAKRKAFSRAFSALTTTTTIAVRDGLVWSGRTVQ